MKDILILYYSKNDSTKRMARAISRGVESVANTTAVIRTVNSKHYAESDDLLVSKEDLKNCSGMIIGSPTHFGNMAAPLKDFFDNTTEEWLNNNLESKLGGVFTSTSSMHGGQETTLLTMAIPLIRHCMLITGVPYSTKELSNTTSGGTPYGPRHVASTTSINEITSEEKVIAQSLGKRIALITSQINPIDS